MLVVNKLPRSLSAEAYKALRTNIKYASVDKKLQTIVVTSSQPGEGKSTVAGNLAYTLSKDGARVLLMDCDLRKPTLHKKLDLINEKGVTDFLVDKCDIKLSIHEVEDNLFVMPSGSRVPNPSEILGSRAMEEFLNDLKRAYDYIILDTPPVIPVTDGLILAGKADGTILVARSRKTQERILKQSYRDLTNIGANIIGSVLTDLENTRYDKYHEYYGTGRIGFRSKRRK